MTQQTITLRLTEDAQSLLKKLEDEHPLASRATIVNTALKRGLEQLYAHRGAAHEDIVEEVRARRHPSSKRGRTAKEAEMLASDPGFNQTIKEVIEKPTKLPVTANKERKRGRRPDESQKLLREDVVRQEPKDERQLLLPVGLPHHGQQEELTVVLKRDPAWSNEEWQAKMLEMTPAEVCAKEEGVIEPQELSGKDFFDELFDTI